MGEKGHYEKFQKGGRQTRPGARICSMTQIHTNERYTLDDGGGTHIQFSVGCWDVIMGSKNRE